MTLNIRGLNALCLQGGEQEPSPLHNRQQKKKALEVRLLFVFIRNVYIPAPHPHPLLTIPSDLLLPHKLISTLNTLSTTLAHSLQNLRCPKFCLLLGTTLTTPRETYTIEMRNVLSGDENSLVDPRHVDGWERKMLREIVIGGWDGSEGGDPPAPTRLFVLLLAPRASCHPFWTPKQQLRGPSIGARRGIASKRMVLIGQLEGEAQHMAGVADEGAHANSDDDGGGDGNDSEKYGGEDLIWYQLGTPLVGFAA
ncbi:hypothetical protein BC936DRAFT_142631 [Jimgerdemannia flammicorona]|uniref:Uncharacterized protein n=1 Tax=Jimgerdemannia flammicorona TaxID=994334 RepID=A0A433DEV2_9FUNG|nr:hypothetical protein BC936DRAFT_142631 [Jimgerdemannia flammicorona]